MADYTGSCGDTEAEFEPILEKRTTANCLPHTLPDFLPSNITGLKKFPEAAYPYKDPAPSDQRGPCPGMNTLANHGYIPRNGITTVAQTVVAAARVFNMGADLTTFLAGGSVLFAGDIPTMRYSIGVHWEPKLVYPVISGSKKVMLLAPAAIFTSAMAITTT
ncbi:hypothetical protein VTO58DRAFT_103443 [Aureobasidium pullulans]